MISEQQYDFMPRKSTADEMFVLRLLMKSREGQNALLCVGGTTSDISSELFLVCIGVGQNDR